MQLLAIVSYWHFIKIGLVLITKIDHRVHTQLSIFNKGIIQFKKGGGMVKPVL